MSDKIERLQEAAIDTLLTFLTGPKAGRENKESKLSAKLSVQTLSAVGRIKATDRARDATQLVVLRMITADQSKLQEYIKVSMPHLVPQKLLGSK